MCVYICIWKAGRNTFNRSGEFSFSLNNILRSRGFGRVSDMRRQVSGSVRGMSLGWTPRKVAINTYRRHWKKKKKKVSIKYQNVIGMDSQSGDQHILEASQWFILLKKEKWALKSPEPSNLSPKYKLTCLVHFEYTQITKDPSMQRMH